MSLRIYTKTGDKGETSLLGGTRLPKHHVRIEAYGTVDELNSHMGLLRDISGDHDTEKLIASIQDRLFSIGSHLAAGPKNKMKLPALHEEDVVALEKAIDTMDQSLPPMKSFILPGGHEHVSFCHIARCVCRRAERAVLRLQESEPTDEFHIKYLNRLSDYLFMLARWMSQKRNAKEIAWNPKNE